MWDNGSIRLLVQFLLDKAVEPLSGFSIMAYRGTCPSQVIVIDPVVLSIDGDDTAIGMRVGGAGGGDGYLHTCQSHDYELMKPIVLAGWRLAQHSASRLEAGKSEVIAEARVLQETIQVPNSKASSLNIHGEPSGLSLVFVDMTSCPLQGGPSGCTLRWLTSN